MVLKTKLNAFGNMQPMKTHLIMIRLKCENHERRQIKNNNYQYTNTMTVHLSFKSKHEASSIHRTMTNSSPLMPAPSVASESITVKFSPVCSAV